MTTARPPVTAVVVAYNSATVLPRCLAALTQDNVPTIVVDNNSSDGSAEIARAQGARVIRGRHNEGYGRGNNLGVHAAGTELCLIVNPDVVVARGTVTLLAEAAHACPWAAVFGPRLVEPDGRIFFRHGSVLEPAEDGRDPPQQDCDVAVLSGAALLVRRSVFTRLGGFDPSIFLFYEDDDLCFRMRAAGHALRYVHAAEAMHLRGKSSVGSAENIRRMRFHQAWSRVYVCRKHGRSSGVKNILPVQSLKYMAALLRGDPLRRARYAGSVHGAWSALTGGTAIAHEGLLGEDRVADAIFLASPPIQT
ncbi:MAG: glycosyltransferase family 2 protein [Hyphomicrobiaceae bacterium]